MNDLFNSFAARLANNVKHTYESMEQSLKEGDIIESKFHFHSGETIEFRQLTVLNEDLIAFGNEDSEGRPTVFFCRPQEIHSAIITTRQGKTQALGFSVTIKDTQPLPSQAQTEAL